MTQQTLTGPVLSGPTLAPARGPARHLVVLIHGYGADGKDLIGLADHWRAQLPGAAFCAPNAPERVPGGPGFQWFPITRIDPHDMHRGVRAAAPALDAFVDGELARLGLPPDRLVLAGFSQGAMLALHLGLCRRPAPAAIVGFSGLLAGPPPPDAALPPILLTHGDSDTVIPPQAMFLAAMQLGAAGAAVQWHLAQAMGHGIDPQGLALAGGFLKLAFDGQLERTGPAGCPCKGAGRIG